MLDGALAQSRYEAICEAEDSRSEDSRRKERGARGRMCERETRVATRLETERSSGVSQVHVSCGSRRQSKAKKQGKARARAGQSRAAQGRRGNATQDGRTGLERGEGGGVDWGAHLAIVQAVVQPPRSKMRRRT